MRIFSLLSVVIIGVKASLLLYLCSGYGAAQEQPLSRNDSALVFQHIRSGQTAFVSGDLREASRYYNDAAFIYWNHNAYPKAIVQYEQSLKIAEKLGNENGVAMINNNLGMLYADVGDYPKALVCFDKTLAARRYFNEKRSLVAALINKSVVLNNLKRHNDAIAVLEEALGLAKELSDLEQVRSCYGSLSETYEKAHNAEQALYYFDLFKAINNSLTGQEKKAMQTKLENEELRTQIAEIEQKEKERQFQQAQSQLNVAEETNETLTKNLSAKELALQLKEAKLREADAQAARDQAQERMLMLVLGIVAIAATIVIALIYRNNRRTQRYNRQLAARNAIIAEQNDSLQNLNKLKDRLFSIISHDMRGPIAAIYSSMGLIANGALPEAKVRIIADRLHKDSRATLDLLETLLQWAKSQLSGATLSRQPTDMHSLSAQTIDVLTVIAQPKNIALHNELPPALTVNAESEMIKLVIRNLVSNAIKFTPAGGTITIRQLPNEVAASAMPPASQYIVIGVIDTGVGVSPENQAKLFGNTTNFTTKGTAQEPGTGLGLMMCRDFVRLHGGEIGVQSTVGKGSTFWFSLPV